MPSRCAVTSLLVYNQCVIYHLVTDDSNFGYFNSLVERLKAIYSFSYCYELNDSRFYLPFSSFGKEENGVTIVYYCLVHSFADLNYFRTSFIFSGKYNPSSDR